MAKLSLLRADGRRISLKPMGRYNLDKFHMSASFDKQNIYTLKRSYGSSLIELKNYLRKRNQWHDVTAPIEDEQSYLKNTLCCW